MRLNRFCARPKFGQLGSQGSPCRDSSLALHTRFSSRSRNGVCALRMGMQTWPIRSTQGGLPMFRPLAAGRPCFSTVAIGKRGAEEKQRASLLRQEVKQVSVRNPSARRCGVAMPRSSVPLAAFSHCGRHQGQPGWFTQYMTRRFVCSAAPMRRRGCKPKARCIEPY